MATESTHDPWASVSERLLTTVRDAQKIVEALGTARSPTTAVDPWRAEVLSSLAREVAANCARMRLLLGHLDAPALAAGVTRLNFPLLCFVVRNLLELSVWSEFCSRSCQNARSFYDDFVKDSLGFQKAVAQFLNLVPSDASAAEAAQVMATVEEATREAGLSTTDDRYMRTAEAARQVGIQEFYTSLNRVLSKLAHPTAMALLVPVNDEGVAKEFAGVFVVGFALATMTCAALRKHVESLGIIFE